MKIEPLDGIVYLKMDKGEEGILDTSSRSSAIESAEVLAAGTGAVKKGDKVFVKSWAIDMIDYKGEKFYFVNIKTNGILAVVR